MGIIIISLIIGAIIWWNVEASYFWYEGGITPKKILHLFAETWAALLMIEVLVAFFLSLIGICISLFFPTPKHEFLRKEPIYALEDNTRTYVWRSGSTNHEELYFITEDDLGFVPKSINAKKCHIQYTEEDPYIAIYKNHFPNKILDFLFFNMDPRHYIFHVPYGSISSNFNIDLKG